MKSMMSVAEVSKLILDGKRLFLAGSESVLSLLPQGDWIAGTIPYFMSEDGGINTHTKIQVTILPDLIMSSRIVMYDTDSLPLITKSYSKNGFSFIVIPAFSEVHQVFAKDCSSWSGVFNQPLVGWISGMDLKHSTSTPKIFNGTTGEVSDEKAIVMHIELPEHVLARANIINLFSQGNGDTVSFISNGFEVNECIVNGKKTNFAKYITENAIDIKLPLVANYMGAMVNVSLRDINLSESKVRLYAPVFPNIEYRFATPIGNYETEFAVALEKHKVNPIYACNCILNFIYANLEGKKVGSIVSAMTFGEVAYMLLNQTLVYLTLDHQDN